MKKISVLRFFCITSLFLIFGCSLKNQDQTTDQSPSTNHIKAKLNGAIYQSGNDSYNCTEFLDQTIPIQMNADSMSISGHINGWYLDNNTYITYYWVISQMDLRLCDGNIDANDTILGQASFANGHVVQATAGSGPYWYSDFNIPINLRDYPNGTYHAYFTVNNLGINSLLVDNTGDISINLNRTVVLPHLSSPAPNTQQPAGSITFQWEAVAGADHYILYIDGNAVSGNISANQYPYNITQTGSHNWKVIAYMSAYFVNTIKTAATCDSGLSYFTVYQPTKDDLIIPDNTTILNTENITFTANKTITANIFTIESGGRVTFNAGNAITLNTGFTADTGSVFETIIGQ